MEESEKLLRYEAPSWTTLLAHQPQFYIQVSSRFPLLSFIYVKSTWALFLGNLVPEYQRP